MAFAGWSNLLLVGGLLALARAAQVLFTLGVGRSDAAVALCAAIEGFLARGACFALLAGVVALAGGGMTLAGIVGAAHARDLAFLPLACAGAALFPNAANVPDPLATRAGTILAAQGRERGLMVIASDLELLAWATVAGDLMFPTLIAQGSGVGTCLGAIGAWCLRVLAATAALALIQAAGTQPALRRLPALSALLAGVAVLALFAGRLE
jgi:hypothetical protein